MYLEHYDLKIKPFQISADPKFLWLGENHREALAVLQYGILDNKGFLLLTGDVGTGKTTLINALVNSLGKNVVVATIPDPGLELIEFLNYLSRAFGIKKQFSQKGEFLIHFRHFLQKADQNAQKVLLIIDEAQRLSHELLEEIRLLSNIEKQDRKLLNIFFIGQNEFNDLLWDPRNRALRQRITVNYNVYALSTPETAAYIAHRLKIAGTDKEIFTPGAIKEIAKFSGGFPRTINIICDHALLTGYVKGAKKIGAKEVKDCAGDLQIPMPSSRNLGPDEGSSKGKARQERTASRSAKAEQAMQKSAKRKERASGFRRKVLAAVVVSIFSVLAGLGYAVFRGKTEPFQRWLSGMIEGGRHAVIGQIPAAKPPVKASEKAMPRAMQAANGKVLGAMPAETPAKTDEGRALTQPERMVSDTAPLGAAVPQTDSPANQAEASPDKAVSDQAALDEKDSPPVDFEALDEILKQKHIIHFPYDSNEFTDKAIGTLDKIAVVLKAMPSIKINAVGYTDSSGEYNYNKSLSKFRANMVKSYLVGKGVSADQINTEGLGPLRPIDSNKTAEGRQTNRRVEIEFIDKKSE